MVTWKLQERLKVILTVTLVVQLTLIMLLMHGSANTATNANHATSANKSTNADYATNAGTASNSNKLGGKDAAQYVVKGDFAVVETQFTIGTYGTGSNKVAFPSGFNKDNCCVVSVMYKGGYGDGQWVRWVNDTFPKGDGLLDTLVVMLGKVDGTDDTSVFVQGEADTFLEGFSFDVKVVLMKV